MRKRAELLVPSAALARDAAKIFLRARGATVSRDLVEGVTQGQNKMWQTKRANMVAAADRSMQKPQGGSTGWAKQLEASLHHTHTCSGLPGGALAGRTCAGP